jgi:hypothetical protein
MHSPDKQTGTQGGCSRAAAASSARAQPNPITIKSSCARSGHKITPQSQIQQPDEPTSSVLICRTLPVLRQSLQVYQQYLVHVRRAAGATLLREAASVLVQTHSRVALSPQPIGLEDDCACIARLSKDDDSNAPLLSAVTVPTRRPVPEPVAVAGCRSAGLLARDRVNFLACHGSPGRVLIPASCMEPAAAHPTRLCSGSGVPADQWQREQPGSPGSSAPLPMQAQFCPAQMTWGRPPLSGRRKCSTGSRRWTTTKCAACAQFVAQCIADQHRKSMCCQEAESPTGPLAAVCWDHESASMQSLRSCGRCWSTTRRITSQTSAPASDRSAHCFAHTRRRPKQRGAARAGRDCR